MEGIFLGKPLSYWLELEALVAEYDLDCNTATKLIKQNAKLRAENTMLKKENKILRKLNLLEREEE